jgi:hypothetical protein
MRICELKARSWKNYYLVIIQEIRAIMTRRAIKEIMYVKGDTGSLFLFLRGFGIFIFLFDDEGIAE